MKSLSSANVDRSLPQRLEHEQPSLLCLKCFTLSPHWDLISSICCLFPKLLVCVTMGEAVYIVEMNVFDKCPFFL